MEVQVRAGKERKGKEEYLYSAFLHQGTLKALRCGVLQLIRCRHWNKRVKWVWVPVSYTQP